MSFAALSLARLCRQLKKRDGVTMLEFALIVPVLVTLLVAIIELSLIYMTQALMENASASASRLGKTGYVASGMTREQTILADLQRFNNQLFRVDEMSVTSLSYARIQDIGQPEPFVDANHNNQWDTTERYDDINNNGQYDTDQGTPGYGGSGNVVVFTLAYPWRIMTPLLGEALGEGGVRVLSARMVVKNEPYDESAF